MLTTIAMIVWTVVSKGDQSTESLKWLQFIQTIGTFLLPPFICAAIWSHHHPIQWLGLDKSADWRAYILAVVIMICAIPGINLLADLNSRFVWPESLDFIGDFLSRQEEQAALLTERFLSDTKLKSSLSTM